MGAKGDSAKVQHQVGIVAVEKVGALYGVGNDVSLSDDIFSLRISISYRSKYAAKQHAKAHNERDGKHDKNDD